MYKRVLGDYPTFWMYAEELAQLCDAGKSAFSNLRTIMRVAYDKGSKFGLDFASDQSYAAVSDINICSLFCATPYDVDSYMDKASILGGNVTRTILVQMEDELGSGAAEFKNLTPEQEQIISRTLQQMMDNIYTADGALQPTAKIDMGFLERDIRSWCKKKGEEALLSGNEALDVFRKRSSVSAARASTLCYYLYLLEQGVDIRAFCEGKASLDEKVLTKIHKNVRKLYRYFAESVLAALMNRWGEKYNELSQKHQHGAEVKPTARLIDQLTTVFTRQQLDILREQNNNSTDTRFFLSQWKKKGWIEKIGKNQYRKLI